MKKKVLFLALLIGIASFATVTIAQGIRLGSQGAEPSFFAISYNEGDNRISVSTSISKGVVDDLGNNKATINRYNKLISADKNNADLYVKRGIEYTLARYYKAALRDFDKAIKLAPDNTSAYYNRAIAKAGMNMDLDAIVDDLAIVIQKDPDDVDAHYAIGVMYLRQYLMDHELYLLDLATDVLDTIKDRKEEAKEILDFLSELN